MSAAPGRTDGMALSRGDMPGVTHYIYTNPHHGGVSVPYPRSTAGDSAVFNLLFVFLLAGVLTAFLLPAYRSYTLKEHARLAKGALEQLLAQGQVWQRQHPSQAWTFEDLGYTGQALYVSSDGTLLDSANINSIYRISITTVTATAPETCGLAVDPPAGLVMAAEPIQTQRIETLCSRMCLSSSGSKGATGEAGADACWELRKP
jgi:Tfp pilus assembly protein PilE